MFVNVSLTHVVVLLAYVAITVWALSSVWRSGVRTADKVIWTVVILVLPYLGALLWAPVYLVAQRRRTAGA